MSPVEISSFLKNRLGIFDNGFNSTECKALACISGATEYFYKLGRVSKFLENYF